MSNYEDIQTRAAKLNADAYKQLICKSYCRKPLELQYHIITKEEHERTCMNCPFKRITEVYE